MILNTNYIIKFLIINFLVLLLFLFAYFIVTNLPNFAKPYGSLVFLPNALRVICPLIFGLISIPGLFLGHVLAGIYLFQINSSELIFLLSIEGSLVGFFALYILKIFKILELNFKNIKFEKILFFVLLVSLFHAIFAFLIFDYNSNESFHSLKFIFSYFVGDFVGGTLGFYLFLKGYKYFNMITNH
tara:strand:- start:286 stop:843 length:558 start_codon:yes stop_codon:yes gene_type:complete